MKPTTLQHEDTTLTLTQAPYLAGTDSAPCFRAAAQGDDGNAYLVTWWQLKRGWQDLEDLSDCCEWSSFEVSDA